MVDFRAVIALRELLGEMCSVENILTCSRFVTSLSFLVSALSAVN